MAASWVAVAAYRQHPATAPIGVVTGNLTIPGDLYVDGNIIADIFTSSNGTVMSGFHCWDLDQDHECDTNEDFNEDGLCTVADCDGVDCWDLDENRACNVTTEDKNGDGICSVLDCKGTYGTNGTNGSDGEDCWDLDNNNICNVTTEDKNGDGLCTYLDCNGAACWDFDSNFRCNVTTEDINGDGWCDVLDCKGDIGNTGLTGNNGSTGLSGIECWDLNQNRECDFSTEDKNIDGVCTPADCIGPAGEGVQVYGFFALGEALITQIEANYTTLTHNTSTLYFFAVTEDERADRSLPSPLNGNMTGNMVGYNIQGWHNFGTFVGIKGDTGLAGINCWDVNQNRFCDPLTEDVNGDGSCTYADCTLSPAITAVNSTDGHQVVSINGAIFRYGGNVSTNSLKLNYIESLDTGNITALSPIYWGPNAFASYDSGTGLTIHTKKIFHPVSLDVESVLFTPSSVTFPTPIIASTISTVGLNVSGISYFSNTIKAVSSLNTNTIAPYSGSTITVSAANVNIGTSVNPAVFSTIGVDTVLFINSITSASIGTPMHITGSVDFLSSAGLIFNSVNTLIFTASQTDSASITWNCCNGAGGGSVTAASAITRFFRSGNAVTAKISSMSGFSTGTGCGSCLVLVAPVGYRPVMDGYVGVTAITVAGVKKTGNVYASASSSGIQIFQDADLNAYPNSAAVSFSSFYAHWSIL